jgi:hypothetical protein
MYAVTFIPTHRLGSETWISQYLNLRTVLALHIAKVYLVTWIRCAWTRTPSGHLAAYTMRVSLERPYNSQGSLSGLLWQMPSLWEFWCVPLWEFWCVPSLFEQCAVRIIIVATVSGNGGLILVYFWFLWTPILTVNFSPSKRHPGQRIWSFDRCIAVVSSRDGTSQEVRYYGW